VCGLALLLSSGCHGNSQATSNTPTKFRALQPALEDMRASVQTWEDNLYVCANEGSLDAAKTCMAGTARSVEDDGTVATTRLDQTIGETTWVCQSALRSLREKTTPLGTAPKRIADALRPGNAGAFLETGFVLKRGFSRIGDNSYKRHADAALTSESDPQAVNALFGHRLDPTRESSPDRYSSSPSTCARPRRAQYRMKYTGTVIPAIRNAATPQAVA